MTGPAFEPTPAHWLILAFGLGVLEALFPGAVFLWFAIAAAIVGALAYLFPLDLRLEVVLFCVLALASIAAWRWWRSRQVPDDTQSLNRRGRQYEGQVCELVEPIHNGLGRARVADGVWTVAGPDLPAGASVRVVSVEGTVLNVVAADSPSPGTR